MVKIIAAERSVAVRGEYFKHAFGEFQNGDVKRATAKVVHGKYAFFRFRAFGVIQTVGNRRCGWLVEQAQYIESGDLCRVFGRLALRIVKIGRYGDDRTDQFASQCGLRTLI